MTTAEIKESNNMTDVLSEYGIRVSRGMCKCPFHNDKSPSMKVYPDAVTCFACGESWDIFAFVMKMENIDFKTAFLRLGGTYEHQSKVSSIWEKARRESIKSKRQRALMTHKQLFQEVSKAMIVCQLADEVYAPYSEEWCFLKDKLPVIQFFYAERFIYGSEIKEIGDEDVYRTCREINRRFLPNERDIRGITKPRIGIRSIDRVRKVTKEGQTAWINSDVRSDVSSS